MSSPGHSYRTCSECGGAWFTLAPGEIEVHGTKAKAGAAVCFGLEGEVIAWTGNPVCMTCFTVLDLTAPSPPPLVLVPNSESGDSGDRTT